MGSIFNSIITIGIYGQLVTLLREVTGRELVEIRQKVGLSKIKKLSFFLQEEILAAEIVLYHDIIMQTSLYMTDLTGVPLALEMLRIILKKKETIRTNEGIYFAILTGFFLAFKMTNIVYILPMVAILMVKSFKILNIKLVVLCASICLLPVSIYLLYAFLETGNPIFPYFNMIFYSPYFVFKQYTHVFGVSSLLDVILWPIYMIAKPNYRQSGIPNPFPFPLVGGICFCNYIIINRFKKYRKEKDIAVDNIGIVLTVTYVISMYLWIISTGQPRYFIFGVLINGIMGVIVIAKCLLAKKRLFKMLSFILMGLLVMQPINAISTSIKGREWSWRRLTTETFNQNVKYLFSDHEIKDTVVNDIELMALTHPNGGLAKMMTASTPIISLHYLQNYSGNPELESHYLSVCKQYIVDGKGVYDLVYSGTIKGSNLEKYENTLSSFNFFIDEIIYLDTHIYPESDASLVLIKLGCI